MKISGPGCGVNLANILPLYTVCSCSRENGVKTDFSGFTGGDGFSGFFMQKDDIEADNSKDERQMIRLIMMIMIRWRWPRQGKMMGRCRLWKTFSGATFGQFFGFVNFCALTFASPSYSRQI